MLQTRAIAPCKWGGKSGQQRATHRLMAGIPIYWGRESATENNYH